MCVHEDDALKVAYIVHTECNTLKQASAKSILNNLFVVTVFGPKRLRRTNWALLTVASYETEAVGKFCCGKALCTYVLSINHQRFWLRSKLPTVL